MKVIHATSAHHGLYEGIQLLDCQGVRRHTRNDTAIVAPCPVTTVFENPERSLVWYPERDVNIAFLIYEALWMLEGRNDVLPLTRYIKRMISYSDDGLTLRASSYGHRWRKYFGFDQLEDVIIRLTRDSNDRRSVLGMWDPRADLRTDDELKDLPCNMTIAFHITVDGELDMTVFNRSNDILWGTYFANVFHFSMLHIYLATRTGRTLGKYYQISNNFHLYESLFDKTKEYVLRQPNDLSDHYELSNIQIGIPTLPTNTRKELVMAADLNDLSRFGHWADNPTTSPYYRVLAAHEHFRGGKKQEAMELVTTRDSIAHQWVFAMRRWLEKRV